MATDPDLPEISSAPAGTFARAGAPPRVAPSSRRDPGRSTASDAGAESVPPAAAGTPPARWRVIVDGERPGPDNMALDHALSLRLAPDTGVLRVYGWERPTVSFGRNEPARGLYDPAAADREGVSFVRRPTGGRVVLHDQEVTYAVVAPSRGWGRARGAYRVINEGLVSALRALGVGAELAGPPASGEAPLSAGPCFQIPARGEVVAHGRKLVGSAQARMGGALLQHGSLLLSGSQDPLARIGPEATAEAGARPTTLRSLLGTIPSRERIHEALVEGFRTSLGGVWEEDELTSDEKATAEELTERYASREWTWRR